MLEECWQGVTQTGGAHHANNFRPRSPESHHTAQHSIVSCLRRQLGSSLVCSCRNSPDCVGLTSNTTEPKLDPAFAFPTTRSSFRAKRSSGLPESKGEKRRHAKQRRQEHFGHMYKYRASEICASCFTLKSKPSRHIAPLGFSQRSSSTTLWLGYRVVQL